MPLIYLIYVVPVPAFYLRHAQVVRSLALVAPFVSPACLLACSACDSPEGEPPQGACSSESVGVILVLVNQRKSVKRNHCPRGHCLRTSGVSPFSQGNKAIQAMHSRENVAGLPDMLSPSRCGVWPSGLLALTWWDSKLRSCDVGFRV